MFVDNREAQFTADRLARIEDAIAEVNVMVGPYGINIYQVDVPRIAEANVLLEISPTSIVGGYADGILGCSEDGVKVTLIEGWDWYVGSDATQISLGQYDFQTIVTHEIGHTLGLGHSALFHLGDVRYSRQWRDEPCVVD